MTPSVRSVLSFAAVSRACGFAGHSEHLRWIVGFVVMCSVLLGAALFVIWAASGFGDLGVSGHGLVALILGIVLTSALGIVLMALSFYSDRSGSDRRLARRRDTDAE